MFKNTVEFEVKNGALYDHHTTIAGITHIVSLFWQTEHLLRPEIVPFLQIDALNTLETASYYMPDGRKITKPLRKILAGVIRKDALEAKWADFCNEVSKLYSPKFNCRAFWGDKTLLGGGTYEDGETCFSDDGINKWSRVFVEKFKRTQVIVLESLEDPSQKARCIAYFVGGRHMSLTNFYFKRGFLNNKLLFVEAVRRLTGVRDVIFKDSSGSPALPIYLNGHHIHIYTKRSFDYPLDRKFPCPHCDTVVSEKKFYHEKDGNTHLIGCCQECAEEDHSQYTCCSCADSVSADEYRTNDNGDIYCESCYLNNYAYCDRCNCEVDSVDIMYSGQKGSYYCRECYDEIHSNCKKCGDTDLIDNMCENDGDYYCQDCYSELFTSCEECGDTVSNNDSVYVSGEGDFCQYCYDKLFAECCDCDSEIRKDDTQKIDGHFYCQDCYDEKMEEDDAMEDTGAIETIETAAMAA